MKAFSIISDKMSQGIGFHGTQQRLELTLFEKGWSAIVLDDKNPPQVSWNNVNDSDPLSGLGFVYDCGIIARTVGTITQYALTAGRPNDNRVLLCLRTSDPLQPYFNETFPKIVFSHKYYSTSYLLIFGPGDTIATTDGSWHGNETSIYQWDGTQFRSCFPGYYLDHVVKPWVVSASKSAIDEAIRHANYPLLRQFLQSGPPTWKEL